jgi:hypothetical protein
MLKISKEKQNPKMAKWKSENDLLQKLLGKSRLK